MASKVIERATNTQFADKVGLHFSMVSKLRHGHRAPSLETVVNIWKEYGISGDEILEAARLGPEKFSEWLNRRVFGEDLKKSA